MIFRLLFVPLLSVTSALLVASEIPRTLDLRGAQKQALEGNPDIRVIKRSLEELRATAGRSRSKYFPTLGVAGGADVDKQGTAGNVHGVGYLYGTYNLYKGNEDSNRTEMSDIEADKVEFRLKQLEFRVGRDVERYFDLYLLKKNAIQRKEEAIKLNEVHEKAARDRRGTGLVSHSDVLEFDLRESILRSEVTLLEQELKEAKTNLQQVLGEEKELSAEPQGELHQSSLKGSVSDFLSGVKTGNENVGLIARDLNLAEIESKIATSHWLPQLDLEARVGYLPGRTDGTGVGYTGLVLAKIDLFSGFDTLWEKRASQAKKQGFEAKLSRELLTAQRQIEILVQKIRAIEVRADLEKQNEVRAKKYYESVLSEYKRGIKSSSDVKNAAEALLNSGLRREEFKYQFIADRIELEKTIGTAVEVVAQEEKR